MITAPWLPMALLGLAFLAVLGAGEALARRAGLPPELTRKLDHALAGPVALAVPFVLDAAWQVLALASAFLVFLSMTSLAGRLGSVHGIARRSVGAYLYPVAIAATWFATQGHPERYAVAILALSLADAAGGLVGERWGRRSYLSWGQPKSWEGSLATLVVTAVISVPVLLAGGMAPAGACLAAAMVALVVALVEGSLPYGLDNLGVPLAAVAALASLDSPLFAELLLAGAVAGFGVALAFPGALARARSRPRRRALPELR